MLVLHLSSMYVTNDFLPYLKIRIIWLLRGDSKLSIISLIVNFTFLFGRDRIRRISTIIRLRTSGLMTLTTTQKFSGNITIPYLVMSLITKYKHTVH